MNKRDGTHQRNDPKGESDDSLRIEPRRGLPDHIFLHYLNPELTTLYGVAPRTEAERDRFFQRVEVFTRYALLTAEQGIVFPASYLYETSMMRELLRRLNAPARQAFIKYASSTEDLSLFAHEKSLEYPDGFREYSTGVSPLPQADLTWVPRTRSTSGHIGATWRADLKRSGGIWNQVFRRVRARGDRLPRNVESAIQRAPDALEGKAFILRYVLPFLPKVFGPSEHTLINLLFLNRAYLESYLSEYRAVIFVDTPGIADMDCGLRQDLEQRWTISLLAIRSVFAAVDVVRLIEQQLDWSELTELRYSAILRWLIARAIENPPRFQLASDGFRPQRQSPLFPIGAISISRLEAEFRELYYHVLPKYPSASFTVPIAQWTPGSRVARPVNFVYIERLNFEHLTLRKEETMQITNSNVNISSTLTNVVQTIDAAAVPDDARKDFERLVREFEPLLGELQKYQAGAAASIADSLERTAKYADARDPATKSLLKSTGDGLLAAAVAVANYAPGLIEAAEKVVKWIQTLS